LTRSGLWLTDPPSKTRVRPTPPRCVPAASAAASSSARWPTAPTGSPTPWSATKPATTPHAGCRHTTAWRT